MSSGGDLMKLDEAQTLERAETVLRQVNVDLKAVAARRVAAITEARAERKAKKPQGPLSPEQILFQARIGRRQAKKQQMIERKSFKRPEVFVKSSSKMMMCVRNHTKIHSPVARKYFKLLGLGRRDAAFFVPNNEKYNKMLEIVCTNVFYGFVSPDTIRKFVRTQAATKIVDPVTKKVTVDRITDNLRVEKEFEDLGLLCIDDIADAFISGDEVVYEKLRDRLGCFVHEDPRRIRGSAAKYRFGFQQDMEEVINSHM